LHAERWVGGRQFRGENEQGLMGAAEVAGQEVWEDCARSINGRGVRVVIGVPLVLEFREGLGRFGGSQNEVLLGIIRLILCVLLVRECK
jgi:hypothetical protein